MDYEQKYKEALERAKGAHNGAKSDKENGVTDKITEYTIQLTETIFPELKESEDEKVIRDIKVVLESSATKFFKEEGKMPIWYDRAIAWLEKQSEQKHETPIPRFNIGDWVIVHNKDAYQVINKKDYSRESKNACYPATKDEQTILFERIKEAGYEWDATKKQLKKL